MQINQEGGPMLGFFIAMISGALMAIQGVFNTGVTKESGPWLTNSFVQLTGLVVCLSFYFFSEQKKVPVNSLFEVDHKYMLLGGVIGAFITFTVVQSMSALGPAKATMAIVVTQVLAGYLIELFGLFGVEKVPFSIMKVLGVVIAIAGIVLFKWES